MIGSLLLSRNSRNLQYAVVYEDTRSTLERIAILASRCPILSTGDFTVKRLSFAIIAALLFSTWVFLPAQGPRPEQLGASNLDIGQPGIQWYTTWETAEAEAKRSGRAIMFVAAATQCHGVSGVF